MVKLGSTFSDSIERSSKRRLMMREHALTGWGARLTLLQLLLIISFSILAIRVFHLTFIRGTEYRRLSEENRVRTATIHAPRGIIYDRMGVALAENIPGVRVVLPCVVGKPCNSEFKTEDEFKKSNLVDSVYVETDYLRTYTDSMVNAHVIGYLTEVTQEELSNPYFSYQGYLVGDRIGRMGVEETFEKTLRGTDGKELIEVDSQGKKIRTLGKLEAIKGDDVQLSLDMVIQKVAYEALGENPGAVIVSKPKTGELIALVSTPSFNPNLFHTGLTSKEYNLLVSSSDRPLFNRAISGVYPPGSTFKIIASVAGLESGKITQDDVVDDIGVVKIGSFSFSNWYFTQYGKTDGQVNLVKALARSNDIYFYKLGETVGITTLAEWGKKFRIGEKTGIEIDGEAQGVMPTPEWRKKVRGEEWYLGDTYHIGIGQGDLQTTPLHVNHWTNIIASHGIDCNSTIIHQTSVAKDERCRSMNIKNTTLDVITLGMVRACSGGENVEYQGTGWPLFNFSILRENLSAYKGQGQELRIPIACKTGTAETGDAQGKTHAWLTAFAPIPEQFVVNTENTLVGEPEIAVTVLVEKGGEGSSVAAPIAKKIFEAWFKKQ